MKYLKRFIENFISTVCLIALLILTVASIAFIFGGAVIILYGLLQPSTIKVFGIWKSIVFVIAYISSLALFRTIDEFQKCE